MTSHLDAATLAEHAQAFRGFAAHRAGRYAPFTGALARGVAERPVLLEIAAGAQAGQSRVDLLLAALHRLVLDLADTAADTAGGASHPVVDAYAAASGAPAPGTVETVLAFAHDHRDALGEIVATRTVQTNEIGRTAFLLPGLIAAGAGAGGRRLAVVEVGASAGLNLVPDRYRLSYYYRDEAGRGPESDGPIQLEPPDLGAPAPTLRCELHGVGRPALAPAPDFGMRTGLDLQPLDPTDTADQRWLRALVWPEHTERRERLDQALALAAVAAPPAVHQGDAAEVAGFVESVPHDQHPVVTHCAVTAHMTAPAREAFAAAVRSASRGRALSWLQAEPRADGDPRRLRLLHLAGGDVVAERALAGYHPHGATLTWYQDQQPRAAAAGYGALS